MAKTTVETSPKIKETISPFHLAIAKANYDELLRLVEKNFNPLEIANSIAPKYLVVFYVFLINASSDFFSDVQLQETRFKLYQKLFNSLNSRIINKPANLSNEYVIYVNDDVNSYQLIFKSIYIFMESLRKLKTKTECTIKTEFSDIDDFFEVNNHIKEKYFNIYNFCLADHLFNQRKLVEAEEILPPINKCNDKYLKLDIKRLELKILYEKRIVHHGNSGKTVFDSAILSFRSHNNSDDNKIAEKHKTFNRDFANFTINIYKIKVKIKENRKVAKEEIIYLQNEIKKAVVPDKIWLIAKCEELL